jgi:hypothetical protein
MTLQVREFADLAARARELGCRVPVRIALLPSNFATAANSGEFRYHAATPYIRSAWQSVSLVDEGPGSELGIRDSGPERTNSGLEASSGIPAPVSSPQPFASAQLPLVAFFGSGLLTDPEWRLTVALGMVGRVLALDPRCASPRDVRLDVVVERSGARGCICIEYQGDACGIVELVRIVRRIWADERTDRADTELAPDAQAPSRFGGSCSGHEEWQHLQCRLEGLGPELDLGCQRESRAGETRSADAQSEQDQN